MTGFRTIHPQTIPLPRQEHESASLSEAHHLHGTQPSAHALAGRCRDKSVRRRSRAEHSQPWPRPCANSGMGKPCCVFSMIRGVHCSAMSADFGCTARGARRSPGLHPSRALSISGQPSRLRQTRLCTDAGRGLRCGIPVDHRLDVHAGGRSETSVRGQGGAIRSVSGRGVRDTDSCRLH